MVITDSLKLYEKACQYGRQYSSQRQGGYNSNGYNTSYNQNVDLEAYYVQIIGTMFYELITKRSSPLLVYLCSVNNVQVNVVNFSIPAPRHPFKSTYDLIPILEGINTAFTKNLAECGYLFSSTHKNNVFKKKIFADGFDYISSITSSLKMLDDNIGRVLSTSSQTSQKSESQDGLSKSENAKPNKSQLSNTSGMKDDCETQTLSEEEKKANIEREQRKENLLEAHQKLATARKENDAAVLGKLQELQVQVQAELKQLTDIREDINYNIAIESIEQLISIYNLISEVYTYHSQNKTTSLNYKVLIDNCLEFLEAIKQSLSYLGVSAIGKEATGFDAKMHESDEKAPPTRGGMISQVVRLGFEYKGKVVQKALVRINR